MNDLAAAWIATAGPFAPTSDVEPVGADLLNRYAEQHRRYHGIDHLRAVLSHIDELAAHAEDAGVVRLAAWFHDAIYDPRATDNETNSALLAERVLPERGVQPLVVKEIVRLILLTASHQPEEGDRNGTVLCDADLAILGATQKTYRAYVVGVRNEYEHLDDAAFRRGRALVLRRLLARNPLFNTPSARDWWEERARQNVTAELAKISVT